MGLAEKKRVDNFINDYRILKYKIRVLEIKKDYAIYNNNIKQIKRLDNSINKLKEFDNMVKANIKNEYLELVEIFNISLNEAVEELGISKGKVMKLKNNIREEFYKILDTVEAK